MPYNGSGTFTPYTPGNPVITGTTISSTAFNATQSDIAAGLSNAITRDGQSPPTANLPMGGRKMTGLAGGTVSGDSLRWEQLFSQGIEQDIASASTTDIGALNTTNARITGTTTITSFGTNYNGPRFVRFAGVLTLTHNATTLILPGGASITTAAGDCLIAVPNGSSPNGWRVVAYQVAALVPGTASSASTLTGTVAIANGGTGQTTASAAFDALKQAATESATGVVELSTDAEAQAADATKVLTGANLKAAQIQLGTAVTLTTQTSVDFTGIPSWAKRVTLHLVGVSLNGTDNPLVQLGDSGGVEATGYLGSSSTVEASVASTGYSTGFGVRSASAANVLHGSIVIEKQTGNTWIAHGVLGASNAAFCVVIGGSKTLSDVLDRVRITTLAGSNQFDAGSINVSWE